MNIKVIKTEHLLKMLKDHSIDFGMLSRPELTQMVK